MNHFRSSARTIIALCAVFTLAACSVSAESPALSATPSRPPATVRPTVRPSPTPIPPPQSWLKNATLLTIYGRGFGIAPILGRLGMDNNLRDVAAQAWPFYQGVRANNGGRNVRVALHLIYSIATPCTPGSNCLSYLDDQGVNIVKQYIQPAAQRGWLVILDTQLAESGPIREMQRIIARGYMRYDNVEVALDPEFRATPGQDTPGIPVGTVTAAEINTAQRMLSGYCKRLHLAHRKIVILHQFRDFMIVHRANIRMHMPYVDPVIVVDGFGPPGVKASVYHALLGARNSPTIQWRGIKLFYPNPYEQAGHFDSPVMTWRQVFGRDPATDAGGQKYWISPMVSVVVIA